MKGLLKEEDFNWWGKREARKNLLVFVKLNLCTQKCYLFCVNFFSFLKLNSQMLCLGFFFFMLRKRENTTAVEELFLTHATTC